ncbi:MAG: radical SAM protein [bacterium]|nr:radical SAM protein [bacterium]
MNNSPPSRLILLATHDCTLRCGYCRVKKFRAAMSTRVLYRAIDLLFRFNRKKVQLQFFGGEPLLEFGLIKKGTAYAEKQAKRIGKQVDLILTTNGTLLDGEKRAFLKEHNFLVECSLDPEKIRHHKKSNDVIRNFQALDRAGIPHYFISVFAPRDVPFLYAHFKDLVDWGFKRIQLNYCLGTDWKTDEIRELFRQYRKVTGFLKKRKDVDLINLSSSRKEPVILNAELTVDVNSDLYWEFGGFLEEDFSSLKKRSLIGKINDVKGDSPCSLTPSLALRLLLDIYEDKKSRRIIGNNIILGRAVGRFFQKYKNENTE